MMDLLFSGKRNILPLQFLVKFCLFCLWQGLFFLCLRIKRDYFDCCCVINTLRLVLLDCFCCSGCCDWGTGVFGDDEVGALEGDLSFMVLPGNCSRVLLLAHIVFLSGCLRFFYNSSDFPMCRPPAQRILAVCLGPRR